MTQPIGILGGRKMQYITPTSIQNLSTTGVLTITTAGGQLEYTNEDLLERWFRGIPKDGLRGKYYSPIASEFWRIGFNSKHPDWQLPRHFDAQTRRYIKAEAEAWYAAFECLERMNTMGAWDFPIPYTHPVIGLFNLVVDHEMLGIAVAPPNTTNQDKYLRGKCAENRRLANGENPFQKAFTRLFVDKALLLCDRNDRFAEKRWEPLLKARQQVTTSLKEMNNLRIVDVTTGKPVLRKRKKDR